MMIFTDKNAYPVEDINSITLSEAIDSIQWIKNNEGYL